MHHAHLLVGDVDLGRVYAREALGVGGEVSLLGHPDYYECAQSELGIADARAVRSWAYRKPVVGAHKVAVVAVQSLTLEAANALLKMFEEPPGGTRIFLVVPDERLMIPTLRSRLVLVARERVGETDELQALLNEAERLVAAHPEMRDRLLHIMRARRYSRDRGASLAMLREYVALAVSRDVP